MRTNIRESSAYPFVCATCGVWFDTGTDVFITTTPVPVGAPGTHHCIPCAEKNGMRHSMKMSPVRCDEHKCDAMECQGKEHTGEVDGRCDCGAPLVGMISRTNGLLCTQAGCAVCDCAGDAV